MRTLGLRLLTLLPLLLLLALPTAAAAADDSREAAEVKQALAKFDRAYETRDGDAVAALFVHDAESTFYSSDMGERWVGWAAIRAGVGADLKRIKSAKVEGQAAAIHVRGAVAWFERSLVLNLELNGSEMAILARMTGVLEKRAGQWLFVQAHMSVGAPRESGPRE